MYSPAFSALFELILSHNARIAPSNKLKNSSKMQVQNCGTYSFNITNGEKNNSGHLLINLRMIHLPKIFSILLSALLLTSCITEDVPDNTPRGNFELLWQTLDEHYCFFSYKKAAYGLDWDEVHGRYA